LPDIQSGYHSGTRMTQIPKGYFPMKQSAHETAVADFIRRPRPLALSGGVRSYAWGDPDYIPALLGIPNPDRRPYAELWIGTHAGLPSVAHLGAVDVPFPMLLQDAADAVSGPEGIERFGGELPFLLKVLSAAQPLSIQAHPDKQQAETGFARENRLGIPPDASNRNYCDDNHKPELIVALTDFYAVRGFRPLDEIDSVLAAVPELRGLAVAYRPTSESLRELYSRVMRMERKQVDAILTPLLLRLRAEAARQAFSRDQTEYWVLGADALFSHDGHRDRGLFSLWLLNLVHLRPGEAMYLPAGELHSYLWGAGIEIMANSDNVLRGGLTPKHKDVDELLRILTFDASVPDILEKGLQPEAAGVVIYETPSPEFVLARLRIDAERPYIGAASQGPKLGVVIRSPVVVSAPGLADLELADGGLFLIPHGLDYRIACPAQALVFLAGIPTA